MEIFAMIETFDLKKKKKKPAEHLLLQMKSPHGVTICAP